MPNPIQLPHRLPLNTLQGFIQGRIVTFDGLTDQNGNIVFFTSLEFVAEPRRALREALRVVRPGGWLLVEHGHDQGDAVARLLADAGLRAIGQRRDLGGQLRCTAGRGPP